MNIEDYEKLNQMLPKIAELTGTLRDELESKSFSESQITVMCNRFLGCMLEKNM